jgi:hypothetical protein
MSDSDVSESLLKDDYDSDVSESLLKDDYDSEVSESLLKDDCDSDVSESLLKDEYDSEVSESLLKDDCDSKVSEKDDNDEEHDQDEEDSEKMVQDAIQLVWDIHAINVENMQERDDNDDAILDEIEEMKKYAFRKTGVCDNKVSIESVVSYLTNLAFFIKTSIMSKENESVYYDDFHFWLTLTNANRNGPWMHEPERYATVIELKAFIHEKKNSKHKKTIAISGIAALRSEKIQEYISPHKKPQPFWNVFYVSNNHENQLKMFSLNKSSQFINEWFHGVEFQ